MTNTKVAHTPGPWTIEGGGISPQPGTQGVLGAPGSNGPTYIATIEVARCQNRNRYSAPGTAAEANARLIAAAPELLEVCIAAEAYCAFMDRNLGADSLPPLKALRAAIAKAEGGAS